MNLSVSITLKQIQAKYMNCVIKAVDDDCEDSDSLFGIDGQKSLEEFIYKYLN